jgi:hypothetical protein
MLVIAIPVGPQRASQVRTDVSVQRPLPEVLDHDLRHDHG